LGLRVRGKLAPETVNPLPAAVAALTVTDAVPVEDRVTDWVVVVFTLTLPNDKLVALIPRVGTLEPNSNANVSALSPDLAVSFTASGELTVPAVAVKLAFFTPDATVTDAGTVTAVLLLDRLTASPVLAATVFRVTVQMSDPAVVSDPLAQLSPLTHGRPVPFRPTDRGR
jgi:hypothetical protein